MALVSSAIAGTAGVAALLGLGTAGAISLRGVMDKNEVNKMIEPLPEAPTVESAEDKAKEEVKRKKKIIGRTGGKTILESRYGGTVDAQKKTFLGQ